MQSLKDKLLKAGLITQEQASAAAPPPRPEGPRVTVRRQPLVQGEVGPGTAVPKLPPLPGSKAHQRLESRRQVELDRQLRELVAVHQVPLEPGEIAFHFVTRKGKIRRLELSAAQAKLLEEGALAVVERPDPGQIEHALVSADAALKLMELSPKAVRFLNRPGSPIGVLAEDEAPPSEQATGEAQTSS